jgi:MoxR-like ATPase
MPRWGPVLTALARISSALYDRTCRIAMGYQSENAEQQIVAERSPDPDPEWRDRMVRLVRDTREHPDVRVVSAHDDLKQREPAVRLDFECAQTTFAARRQRQRNAAGVQSAHERLGAAHLGCCGQ